MQPIKAPLSKTAPQRVALALRQKKIQCSQLQRELSNMKLEFEKTSVPIIDCIMKILSDSSDKVTSFKNLFWQQQKLFQCNSSTGVRYHPMMICYCLVLPSIDC